MTGSPAPRRSRMLRAGTALALTAGLAAGVLGMTLVPGDAASASLGSVPAEVSAYVTSGPMVARLDDVYGPNASGTAGIEFDDSTKPGAISRVYQWTDGRLANRATDHPVQLTNNWVVPIQVTGKSVGLATIWINPQTVEPELADFVPSATLGTVLSTVPATAALVHDMATGAWLALADGTVTPLVAGSSGLTKPVPVDTLKLAPVAAAPVTSTEPNTGLALAIGIIALIVIVIAVALLLPRGRRARKTATAVVPVEADVPEPAVHQPAAPRPSGRAPTTSAAAKPASSKPSKPSVSRPATSKPAVSKPPVSKPPVSKPPVSKPPAPKQSPRPRAQKPPSEAGPDPEP